MSEDIMPVMIVQLAGSPGSVYTNINEALDEIRELVTGMQNDEVAPATISVRVGTMSQRALSELAEFPGY